MTTGAPERVRTRPAHPDRAAAGTSLSAAVALAAAVAMGAAGAAVSEGGRLEPATGLALGVLVGVLAVVGLPSVSLRLVARLAALVSGGLLVRVATAGSITGGRAVAVLVWIVAVAALMVLAHAVPDPDRPDLGTAGASRGPGGRELVGRVAVVATALVALVLVALPLVLPRLGEGSAAGDAPDATDGSEAPLATTDRLDMTRRPGLSDRVVMSVRTDQPTFWRQETFDVWDGRFWTRSDEARTPVGPDGTVVAPGDDPGARGSDVLTQTITVEVPFARALPAAATPSRVDAPALVLQGADATLTAEPALGAGATYTVESRRTPLSVEALRAADGPVPAPVARRFASTPTTTDRVRVAAEDVVAGETSTYDRVVALEAWMAGRTEYSLDAPLAPEGVDVVDDFLFTSRQGWCEQIASSLVVLARSVGIPARLVTGFVPGERSPLTGEVVVRERQAHAWAEVWFPDLGWVPFDPTADVPLAGQEDARSPVGWLADHVPWIVGGVALVGVVVLGARVLARRWARRPRPTTAAGGVEARLDALGARLGRPREVWETASVYARALAERTAVPEVAVVGAVVDDALYAPGGAGPAEEAAGLAALDRAEAGAGADPPVGSPGPQDRR